ncbi:MAG: DEAD/DEAH box helicase [Planctomycetota bacterium]
MPPSPTAAAPLPGGEDAAARAPLGTPVESEWKGFCLLDFQIRAIAAIRAGANVLVSAPTGAGKTLIAEYAIADAVARGRRCVYTAPIKALSNQKYRDFRDDPAIDVGLLTGDVTIHPTAQVLIMTTEILRNAIFEDPAGLAEVDYVILDEVHFMDDLERGSVWEESLIFAPPAIRFIALSATIANLEQFGAWIGEVRPHELAVIRSERRPVPLKHLLYTEASGAFDVSRLERVRRAEGGSRRDRARGWRRRRESPEGGGEGQDLTRLLDRLQEHGELPALVFSFSRRACERLAARNQHRRLLSAAEGERMAALQHRLIELFQLEEGELRGEVFQLAARGVGYHHAGMLPIHKEVVERMFTSGLIRMLFTTETFALGINMPARTVVFASLRKFDGINFDFLRTRDYLQMAGRAGRQGIDRQGLVVSFLDPRTLAEAPVDRLLTDRPEPIVSRFRLSYSSLLHLLERLGRERLHEAWEKSFNRFQHRARSKKAQEKNRRRQRAIVDAHLALLAELGYVDADDRLTPRGRTARLLVGYELLITEMLFQGVLEALDPPALCVVFVGLVHEDRRRGPPERVSSRWFGGVRRRVDAVAGRLASAEAAFAIPTPLKPPSWGLTRCVAAWCEGAEIEDLEKLTEGTAGDLVRTFRLALMLLRQVRRTLDREDALAGQLTAAIALLNREEVDARRQLELG